MKYPDYLINLCREFKNESWEADCDWYELDQMEREINFQLEYIHYQLDDPDFDLEQAWINLEKQEMDRTTAIVNRYLGEL